MLLDDNPIQVKYPEKKGGKERAMGNNNDNGTLGNNNSTLLIWGFFVGLFLEVISGAIIYALTDNEVVVTLVAVFLAVLAAVVILAIARTAENIRIRNAKIEQSSFPGTVIGLNNSP